MSKKDRKALAIMLLWMNTALVTALMTDDIIYVYVCHTAWIVLLACLYFCKPFMRWLCKK